MNEDSIKYLVVEEFVAWMMGKKKDWIELPPPTASRVYRQVGEESGVRARVHDDEFAIRIIRAKSFISEPKEVKEAILIAALRCYESRMTSENVDLVLKRMLSFEDLRLPKHCGLVALAIFILWVEPYMPGKFVLEDLAKKIAREYTPPIFSQPKPQQQPAPPIATASPDNMPFLICPDKEKREKQGGLLKALVKGRQNKEAALIVEAAISAGVVQPAVTYSALKEAFGDLAKGKGQGFTKYFRKQHFKEEELAPIVRQFQSI